MTKRILAALLALAMALSLCSFEVFAADESSDFDTSSMTLAFSWEGPSEAAWTSSSSLLGADNDDFIAALNKDGAYLEITGTNACTQHGTMTNIKVNDGAFDSLGYPTGKFTRGISAATLIKTSGKSAPITSVFFQFAIYDHSSSCSSDGKVTIDAVKVYVPASSSTTPSGEPVKLGINEWSDGSGNTDWNYQIVFQVEAEGFTPWNTSAEEAKKIFGNVKVEFDFTGAVDGDGNSIDISKFGIQSLVQMNTWSPSSDGITHDGSKYTIDFGKVTDKITAPGTIGVIFSIDKSVTGGVKNENGVTIYLDNVVWTIESPICKHENINDSDWEDSGDGKTHTATCPDCGEEVSEKHTYENGICTKCKAVKPESEKKKTNYPGYVVQLGEEYHGFFMGGFMITMPHTFVGDECTQCGYIRPAAVEEAPAESAE